ncbi:MAG: hypothetical protein KAR42_00485 [candidate division Zixibacteria bacterium]|nr:hypothetical protein [candidate division Zixibacteria bacterium]
MRQIRFFILVLLSAVFSVSLTTAPVSAQAAQTDYAPLQGINRLSSVRSNGMGGATVALTDGFSAHRNPAQIAFPLNRYKVYFYSSPASYTFYESDYPYTKASLKSFKVLASVYNDCNDRVSGYCFNVGFEYLNDHWRFAWPSYSGQYEYGESKQNLYRASIGFGIKHRVSMSCGVNVNWFKYVDREDYRHSVDIGFLLGLPAGLKNIEDISPGQTNFNIYPSLGLSIQQMFLKSTNYYTFGEEITPVKRLGATMKFAWDTNDGQRKFSRFYIMPAYESRAQYGTNYMFGVELGFYEAIQLRYGHSGIHRYQIWNSYGFSLSSNGITQLLWKNESSQSSGLKNLLMNRIDIKFEFAQNIHVGSGDNLNYFGISLTYY